MDEKIKTYLKIINPNIDEIEEENKGLIDFIIGETSDRIKFYLNRKDLPDGLDRILANIINTGLKRSLKEIELSKESNTTVDRVVTSISDNGQSISYANEVMKYFTTTSDEELFTGFTSILSRYRRIKVVYPKNDDERNI